jgi:hypothetical protein
MPPKKNTIQAKVSAVQSPEKKSPRKSAGKGTPKRKPSEEKITVELSQQTSSSTGIIYKYKYKSPDRIISTHRDSAYQSSSEEIEVGFD